MAQIFAMGFYTAIWTLPWTLPLYLLGYIGMLSENLTLK